MLFLIVAVDAVVTELREIVLIIRPSFDNKEVRERLFMIFAAYAQNLP